MKSFNDIQILLKNHKSYLSHKYGVKTLGLFGSLVRNEINSESDIDVLVEFEKPISLFTFIDMENDLTKVLGRKVDLVSQKALKHYIGEQIRSEVVYV